MSLKLETISQFEGFGNEVPKSLGEYFRSSGFTRSALGITASRYLVSWYSNTVTLFPQISALQNVNCFAEGYSRPNYTDGGSSPYLFAVDDQGVIVQSAGGTSDPEIAYWTNKNGSHFGNQSGGITVDQKKRLLYAGIRYLGKFDPSLSEGGVTFDATNGSANIVATSGTFASTDATLLIRVSAVGGKYYFYRINTYTDATHASLYGTWDLPTGSYVAYILRAWKDQWKDFGADYTLNSEGNYARIPIEKYEDTVLFGRGNKITSLNTLTDSITTDASPAFTLPTGFDILSIHKGQNGVLIGSNFQGKGVCVLWDNFSDRSIAPWIQLPDRLISMCKYSGGWLITTAREMFYTNGYSLTPIKDNFLDTSIATLSSNLIPQSSFTSENALFTTMGFNYAGKRRVGLYKMDISSKLFEMYPRPSLDQFNENIKSIFYGAGNTTGRVYVGTTTGIEYLVRDTQPPVAVYITNPLGQGETIKYAEGLKLNIGVSRQVYASESPFTFKVITKICSMEKQIQDYGLVKTDQTLANKIVVNETVYQPASVGDEIEFLKGNNAGYSRNITAITGSGTATATYTFDRDLPALSVANDTFQKTNFRLVKAQTFTNVTRIPEIYHGVKNRYKGKKFLIKIEIEGATVPLEIRPSYFIYEDIGVI